MSKTKETLRQWCLKNNKEYLLDEWDYENNDPLSITPDNVSPQKNIKVHWKCHQRHPWSAQIYSRTKGANCPYCANQKVLAGYNDLETYCKSHQLTHLLTEWDYDKNSFKPHEVNAHTPKKFWWKCSFGHSYETSIYSRVNRGSGCPYCAHQKLMKGFNDMATLHPELLSEWNYNKNKTIEPSDIMSGVDDKVWWLCAQCNYEWEASVGQRKRGSGCPVCAGRKVWKGHNDLASCAPQLASEWDYEKNGNLTPDSVTPHSNKKVWWKCKSGHSWQSVIASRTSGYGCPKCNTQTSFPEQALYYYIKKYFPDAINRFVNLGFELDIYIPSLKTAIEYDGIAFHGNQNNREIRKNKLCKENGITLIRVREESLLMYDNCVCIMRSNRHNEIDLDMAITNTLKHLNVISTEVDTAKDNVAILEQYKEAQIANSFAKRFPEAAKEWHPTLNGNLKPENISYGSEQKVWWLCPYGHEYKTSPGIRSNGCGCPICKQKNIAKKNATPVICVETGIRYNSLKEAHEKTGADTGGIALCCKGMQNKSGGFHWEYAK